LKAGGGVWLPTKDTDDAQSTSSRLASGVSRERPDEAEPGWLGWILSFVK
jgi:hypothetical protein